MGFEIHTAERKRAFVKIAVTGPSGSGKTYSSLLIAKGLAGDLSRVVVIDTENGSAELYSHMGAFQVVPFDPPYSPERYIEAIQVAMEVNPSVIIIDSITPEWDGKGGCLEIADNINAKNSFAKWGDVTPRHRAFIDAMMQAKAHLIATMRSKYEYTLVDKNGKSVPQKLGMGPVQRQGMEYEYSIQFDIDINHKSTISKDRTSIFAKFIDPFQIDAQIGGMIAEWNDSGKPEAVVHEKPQRIIDREAELKVLMADSVKEVDPDLREQYKLAVEHGKETNDWIPVLVMIDEIESDIKSIRDAELLEVAE